MPKKIAIFMQDVHFGGAERVNLQLAKGLLEKGHAIDLVLCRNRGELMPEIAAGINVVDLGVERPILSFWKFRAYLLSAKPNAVLSALNQPNIAAAWAKALSGGKQRLVMAVHNVLTDAARNTPTLRLKLMPYFVRSFAKYADYVATVSESSRQDFIRLTGLSADRVVTAYNPTLTPAIYEKMNAPVDHPWLKDGGAPIILGCGRMEAIKGFDTLIKSFAEARKNRHLRLMIAGDGPEMENLKALANTLSVQDDVAFLGFQPNPYPYMKACPVFALTSVYEGLSGVLIEALACGASVVATNSKSGNREILQDGRLGRLPPVGDVPAIAEAILRSLDNPIKATPADLQRFTAETVVNTYERLLLGENVQN